jgi:hypothetical protein
MKQFQIFNDCCPVCGSSNGYITFEWSTVPEKRSPAWMKGHEIMNFRCECGTKTVIERLPVITRIVGG